MPLLVNLLALTSLALFALTSVPVHVNALVADHPKVARRLHGHDVVAKRKRGDSPSTCRPRPSSSLPVSTPGPSTSAPAPSTSAPAPSTSAPAPSSSSSPSPTSTTSSSAAAPSSTSSSKKWCLAWGEDNQYLSNFAYLSRVGYIYNWDVDVPSNLDGLTFMPMLWGSKNEAQFKQTVVAGFAPIALGMNEVNEPSQANMSPPDGYTMWINDMEPLSSQGYMLGSPSVTNDDSGMQWLQEFMQTCNGGCHVDFMCIHCYSVGADSCTSFAEQVHGNFSLPVAITEFADQNFSGQGGQPSMDDVWNFAGEMVSFVENTDWVMMACPFGLLASITSEGVNANNALVDGNGQPTDLALYYFNGT